MQNDITEIVELQALVWQDHFIRERNMRLPIMRRTIHNMGYYFNKEPGGCMVAVEKGKIIGAVINHVWGSVGWFGPLEVDPRYQGKGIGRQLVTLSLGFLSSKGCKTIGCETMAGSAKNLAFYNKLGFKAKRLSHVLYKVLGDVPPERMGQGPERQFRADEPMDRYRKLWSEIQPGLDYSKEFDSNISDNLGEIWVEESNSRPAHALVHTHDMFEDSQNAVLKLLVADDIRTADILLGRCELSARAAGKTGMFIRSYDASPPELGWFFSHGYTLQGASVRLLHSGEDEAGNLIHISCWSG